MPIVTVVEDNTNNNNNGTEYFDRIRKTTLVDGETYYGYIKDKSDAVLIIEACRRGYLPLVRERLNDFQRESIRCGSVYVFHETSSGIKRWTDGLVWTPSRNLLGFIHYREVQKSCSQKYSRSTQAIGAIDTTCPGKTSGLLVENAGEVVQEEPGRSKLAGTRIDTCKRSGSLESFYKPNGFHKKCISYELQDGIYHLIGYTKIPDSMYEEYLIPSNIRAFQMMKLTSSFAIPVSNKDHKAGYNTNSNSSFVQPTSTGFGSQVLWQREKENVVLTSLQRLAAVVKESRAKEIANSTNTQNHENDRIESLRIHNLLNKPDHQGKYLAFSSSTIVSSQ